jgi:hypothetical protein
MYRFNPFMQDFESIPPPADRHHTWLRHEIVIFIGAAPAAFGGGKMPQSFEMAPRNSVRAAARLPWARPILSRRY